MTRSFARDVPSEEQPDWLRDSLDQGAMWLHPMDTAGGKLHFLCPSGIGDFAWIYAKLKNLILEGRDCTFHFPDASPRRLDDYCRLLGIQYDYLSGLDISDWITVHTPWTAWALAHGNVLFTQANSWLEDGRDLINWLDWLPLLNPAPDGFRWQPGGEEVCVYTASHLYPEGNWFPRVWGDFIQEIEQKAGPARVVGALWDEEFYERISTFYTPDRDPILNQRLDDALEALCRCRFCIGVASGLTILAIYMGVPTIIAYPRKLAKMPGTWEMPDARRINIFVDEIAKAIGGKVWEQLPHP